MDISQIRRDTPGTEKIIHFNNAGSALMPRQVADAIRNYLDEEELNGGYEMADRKRDELNLFYDYAAKLLNAGSHNMAYTTNATDSYNRALSAIPFKSGDVVLISENDYSSNYIAFISLQKRVDIKLVQVRNSATGEIDLGDLDTKLKQYHPRLLSVTHIPTSSGLIQPVNEIGNIVKHYDTLFLLDACQSIGQMKVDALATHADFISGTFRKFIRGPRGAGLLYVSDRALQSGLEPLFIDLHGAEWIAEDQYRPRQDAKRFEDWETAFALMMGSKEALKYILDLGIENIESRNQALNLKMRAALRQFDGIMLQDRGKQQGSIITFSLKGKAELETRRYFTERGINVYSTSRSSAIIDFDEKGIDWALRVSPHYYNTEAEIDTFIEAVKGLF